MLRLWVIAAALLITSLTGIAAAADEFEHQSKNAQKLIATLDSVGINNKDVQDFIAEADSHVDHGYFYIADEKTMGGTLALRYQMDKLSTRQAELYFSPSDSHIEATARPGQVMISYHLEFGGR